MIVSPLESSLLKIERAEKHLTDFRSEAKAFLETKPYSVRIEMNPETGKHAIFAVSRSAIPAALSLLVGDAAHNLRSALDHIVWELSSRHWRKSPKTVPEPDRQVQFPILKKPPSDKDTGFRNKVKSLPPDALELIHSLQPYMVSPREPEFHPLWLLNDLDIWDKHKQLAMRQAIPGVMFVRMTKSTGETVHQRIPLAASVKRGQFIPFEDGAHLCTVETLVGPRSGPFEVDLSIVKVEVSVSVEVAFGYDVAAKFQPVVPVLESCLEVVRGVVDTLAPCFKNLPELYRFPAT